VALLACAAATGLAGRAAQAAVLRLRAPEQCAQAEEVADRVESLLGRPLGAVEGVDFEVDIAHPGGKTWQLRMDRIERGQGGQRSSRQLVGGSCAEVADAAAVAITMSIRASAASEDPAGVASPPTPAPSPTRAPAVAATPVAALPVAGAPLVPRASLTLAAVADTGALPSPGLGAALELALDLGRWRLAGLGAFFPSQTAHAGSEGGDFNLLFGALLGCRSRPVASVVVLACLGGEIGRLAGQGVGVNAPRLGRAVWLAPRADLGVGVPLIAGLTLVARGGVAVPVSRPTFMVDETVSVHQASIMSARGTLGLQFGF
jgi:hypothetical protein